MVSKLFFGLMGVTAVSGQACTDAESNLWMNNYEFTGKLQSCAVKSLGQAAPTSTCLVGAYPDQLSAQCANCFGATVACGAQHCGAICAKAAYSAACLDCTSQNGCDAGLNTCTGFSQGPPKPTPPPGAPSVSPDVTTTTSTTKGSSVYMTTTMAGAAGIIALVVSLAA